VVQPLPAVEAPRFYDERVALPSPFGVPEPARVQVVRELASVEEDLTPQVEAS
jgi:hypothetical protein